jgi:hypothetical protein
VRFVDARSARDPPRVVEKELTKRLFSGMFFDVRGA